MSVSYRTQILLDAIDYEANTQADVAQRYAWAMQYEGDVNWSVVNAAIVSRWSNAGLVRVKRLAWEKASWPKA